MKNLRFLIKLKEPHEKSGLSAYAVAKQLNLNASTVRKFVNNDVVAEFLPDHVLKIIQFYGLDWRDPKVIEIIEAPDEDPEMKSLLALPA